MAEPIRKHDVFQAIADRTRRRMLKMLADEEMSITAITDQFPITRTAVNKHLHILTDAGLVTSHKVGRETRYKLNPEPLHTLKEWLSYYERYWDDRLLALQRYVENDRD